MFFKHSRSLLTSAEGISRSNKNWILAGIVTFAGILLGGLTLISNPEGVWVPVVIVSIFGLLGATLLNASWLLKGAASLFIVSILSFNLFQFSVIFGIGAVATTQYILTFACWFGCLAISYLFPHHFGRFLFTTLATILYILLSFFLLGITSFNVFMAPLSLAVSLLLFFALYRLAPLRKVKRTMPQVGFEDSEVPERLIAKARDKGMGAIKAWENKKLKKSGEPPTGVIMWDDSVAYCAVPVDLPQKIGAGDRGLVLEGQRIDLWLRELSWRMSVRGLFPPRVVLVLIDYKNVNGKEMRVVGVASKSNTTKKIPVVIYPAKGVRETDLISGIFKDSEEYFDKIPSRHIMSLDSMLPKDWEAVKEVDNKGAK